MCNNLAKILLVLSEFLAIAADEIRSAHLFVNKPVCFHKAVSSQQTGADIMSRSFH